METNYNPFDAIMRELKEQRTLIEKLTFNQAPVNIKDLERYEQGVDIACQELKTKRQTVYQRIGDIPHKKIHGKLYFCRAELQAYIKREGAKK